MCLISHIFAQLFYHQKLCQHKKRKEDSAVSAILLVNSCFNLMYIYWYCKCTRLYLWIPLIMAVLL